MNTTKFHPILFSTPMVQALLTGQKTMTRRIVKPQPEAPRAIYNENESIAIMGNKEQGSEGLLRFNWKCDRYSKVIADAGIFTHKCPYGEVGDILWVRETCAEWEYGGFAYKADGFKERYGGWELDTPNKLHDVERVEKWTPSIFMPKAACRIFLEITAIEVQHLQDITEKDAKSEGAQCGILRDGPNTMKGEFHLELNQSARYKDGFTFIWKAINGPESWKENPFVWVIKFKRIDKPENFNTPEYTATFNGEPTKETLNAVNKMVELAYKNIE